MLIAAADTIAMATTSSPTAVAILSEPKAARAYAASPAATGSRQASSAKDAADKAISPAATTNASGACMPARAAAAPIST